MKQHATGARPCHAIVLGGGFAGLLAAHVLARHDAQVTIIDPDPIRDASPYRRGTPQARHPHGMLHRGATVLEGIFPGFSDELIRRGAPVFDFGEGARVLFPSGWASPVTSHVRHHAASRPLLESVLRERVLSHPAIEIADGTWADGLVWRDGQVTGIHDTEGERRLADLVVDATGRTSRLTDWLTSAGLPPPAPRRVRAQLSYTSRLFACTPKYTPAWQVTAELTYAPHLRRGAVAVRIEENRIQLTLIGADGERAPRDDEGFRRYAAGLRSPHHLEVISRALPLGAIYRYGGLDNCWRLYHRMRHWPEGLIAIGDAVCTLNPVYGHGMTVAALEAEILNRLLGRLRDCRAPGFGHAFQQALPTAIRTPWQLAAYSDIGWQDTGRRTPALLAHRTVRRIIDRMPADPDLYRRFIKVQNLTAHPATLAPPAVLHRKPRHPIGTSAPPP
ncbi:NAD(P)/FAD-dependent oxidoreductase [Streptomyces himalayensis]|uniref:NAD(P)-binding protein n=1 Tax=Streptomyces himalayensis subsp. himalayensis TaxID=2756131 RepID=A0A7W0DVQ6_9ACTN|nr:NAD(P)-binding protein [Streptomyces himalayensis]MBA2951795.1 NAD(P)-binding protein [Streptomyces himalayensis subsp. himalayensis]